MNKAPTRKVGSVGVAGALSVILVAILSANDVEVGAELASAITGVLAFLVGYLVPDAEV